MGTYIDEILESRIHQLRCGCKKCQQATNNKSWMDEVFETILEQELGFAEKSEAVAYNQNSAQNLGWGQFKQQIITNVLKLSYLPDEYSFAEAVANWQAQNGFYGKDIDGKIGKITWQKMQNILGSGSTTNVGALPQVNTAMPTGKTYSVKTSARSYGVSETISALQWIAKQWDILYPDIKIIINDISKKGGGKISPHQSHRIGLDADISLVVRATGERIGNSSRTNSPTPLVKNYQQYRHIAKAFVDLVLSNPILKIKVIWYFDHTLNSIIPNSQTSKDHYRHFHLRFCMPQKYVSTLDLNKVYAKGETKAVYSCRNSS